MRTRLFIMILLSACTTACNHAPVETPPDFAFTFKSQAVDTFTLNTFDNTFERSSPSAGKSAVAFHLSKAQLDSVYAFMGDIDFFSLPEYLEPELGVTAFPSPWYTYNVRINGVTKNVRFGGSVTPGVKAIQDLQRLSEFIARMIVNSPEYERLSHS